jgi:Xaa-Pro aminopeptidase
MSDAKTRRARLARIDLPDFGTSGDEPRLEESIFASRYDSFIARIKAVGAEAAVIYGDREHCANLAWLSGFDPRFEEALLIVVPGREPVLVTGPENQGAAGAAPLAMDVRLYPPMGLMGQDRANTPELGDMLMEIGLNNKMRVAVCGWKYFTAVETADFSNWLEIPSYIVDTLRAICGESGSVFNAGSVFMDAGSGLRAVNGIDELARYEYAACHTSNSIKNVILSARPGMQEYEVARVLQPVGMPLSCHTMFSSGKRAWHGLLSPTSRTIEMGDAVTAAYGVQGALNCRAGWLVENASNLPSQIRDYIDVLVAPYFEAIVQWLETIEIGVEGGRLDAIIRKKLGDEFFGIKLNPGHLIHLEEWMNTPISKGSKIQLRSGMALQVDVIPATGGPYFTTNIEDGIALLDQKTRAEFGEKYPEAMTRIRQRTTFMADQLGINLKPDCLPFSNIAGWLPPFWLSPDQAMTMR